ncbi:uncharacterized protein LOC129273987 [Lytechinus pictus]|uniref:uncharacterized protein LOC129273987 n=1 Tax=Lytechinus pictus TaxID=7653 RepID=UPI00240E0A62|nr:uncharacterized protein LOC129273987 [Lytechinus pictus]
MEVVTAKYPYSYKNGNGDSLQMKPGDVFQLIKKSNKDWWYVRKMGEKPVYLPASYLQEKDKPSAAPATTPTSVPSGNGERRDSGGRDSGGRHGNHNIMMQEITKTKRFTKPPNTNYEESSGKERQKRPTELDVIIPAPLRDGLPSPFSEPSSPLVSISIC